MERSSTQQAFVDAPVSAVWDLIGDPRRHPEWWPDWIATGAPTPARAATTAAVVKGFLGREEEHDLVIASREGLREISISCDGTGVTTSFVLAEGQGGTFVEGRFSIAPDSLAMKAIGVVAGRRLMRSWLERSLENLRLAAERVPATQP